MLTPKLSEFEILNDATVIFQNRFFTRLNSISFKTFFSSLTMAKEKSFADLEGLSEAFELFIEERTPTAQCKKWQKKFKRRVHRITRYGLFSIKNG